MAHLTWHNHKSLQKIVTDDETRYVRDRNQKKEE